MFTGIIEQLGRVEGIVKEGSNLRLIIKADMVSELQVDQSVAHNGICLTVENIRSDQYEVVAVKETIDKTTISNIREGSLINLERCMQMNGRLDGHIVQGHVDETAKITEIVKEKGSWIYNFQLFNPTKLIVEKGSVCINGVSLTAFNVSDKSFTVTIIPYTFENTVFKELNEGDLVNIEFDIVGKYIQRMVSP